MKDKLYAMNTGCETVARVALESITHFGFEGYGGEEISGETLRRRLRMHLVGSDANTPLELLEEIIKQRWE